MKKVSIFLPAYKTTFLAEAIQSILDQTFTNFELLIVNDASPECVREIVEKFTDRRICYTENIENQGSKDLVAFWNQELKRCKGEFLLIASDDDFYAPTYLQEMVLLTEKYPEVDLFHCRIKYIDNGGNIIQIAQPAQNYETQMDFIYQKLIWKRKQTLQEFLFRTSALIGGGGIVSFPLAWASDSATAFLMAENGVAYTNNILFSLRMSGVNISESSNYISEKIEAMKQYARWLPNFLHNVKCKTPEEEFMKEEAIRISLAERYASYPNKLQKLGLSEFIKEMKYIARHHIFSWRAILYITLKRLTHL